ncbi:hypothetical protein [Ahniella affigens]|uniref:hypothetical protein n=1 Tax=Ahniella affigens TaxID=2021234 RepID=UPI001472E1CE|nr:hypothetical protein [Ahniella affigens]
MTKLSQIAADPQVTPERQAYVSPCMTDLGTLRDLTLGASPGVGDSGGAGTFKCPGCP